MSPTATKRSKTGSTDGSEHAAVTKFREYLRIKSVQPEPDYGGTNAFLRAYAEDLGLPYRIVEMVKGKPIFLMTWEGSQPELPAVLLNSHTDVVPVFPESWKHDPFAAVKEENGDIYGRGTQDMKCVSIQHLEAVRRLKDAGRSPKRTIHLCFIADEEVGGHDGMMKFAVSQEFKKLNIGFALDEGLASEDDVVPVFYGERNVFWIKFHISGNPGHGSRFIEGTAAGKAHYLINKLMAYRETQRKLLEASDTFTLGDVTTCNLTMMSGGVQLNVVPNEFVLGFDIRITPTSDVVEFEAMLRQWMEEAGGGIEIEFVQKALNPTMTPTTPEDPWFKAFLNATNKHNLKTAARIFPAGTDSRYLRELGIPALGFSPMNNTPVLLHDHNEHLNEKIFLKGIDIFVDLVEEIANV